MVFSLNTISNHDTSFVSSLYMILYTIHSLNAQIILVQTYGKSSSTTPPTALNQGRINAINDWGIHLSSCYNLYITNWTSENQTKSDNYGTQSAHTTPCTKLLVSSNAYKIYQSLNNHTINGLQFFTRNGYIHSCLGNISNSSSSNLMLFNESHHNFWYLTGRNICSGSFIDKIQFQFTQKSTQKSIANILE